MSSIYSNEVRKITEIIRSACGSVVRDFHEVHKIRSGLSDFLKHCYTRVEKFLSAEIRYYKEKSKIDYKFTLFPIDGRRNFISGIPFFTVSVLVKRENEPFICIIEAPLFNYTFWAERGIGAFLEDLTGITRMKVSGTSEIEGALVLTNDFTHNLPIKFNNYRYFGANTLNAAYIANGAADVFIVNTKKINYNLILLAKLLTEESRGRFIERGDELIFANADLIEKIASSIGDPKLGLST